MTGVVWRRLAGSVAHAVPDTGWGLSLCGRSGRWLAADDAATWCEHCQRRLRPLDADAEPVDEGELK